MHTKTIKIAVLLTCFASLSASANPIGDALGKIINWGQNTLHPADPASSAVASAAANSLAAGGTLNTFWNPFTAKPIATPTDAKLKAFHDSVISLAKANASLYAAKKPFPEFYKMYLNNLVAFNSREASQFKVSDLVGKPEFGDIEHELHENILDWGTYSISGSKFEVTPLYSFFAKPPNLPPMWKQYFDVMALGNGRVSADNKNRNIPSPAELSHVIANCDSFVKAYPDFPYAFQVQSVYFSLLHFYLHDPRMQQNPTLRNQYLASYQSFMRTAPQSTAAWFVRRAAARVKASNFQMPQNEVAMMETALGLKPTRYVPVSKSARASIRASLKADTPQVASTTRTQTVAAPVHLNSHAQN